MLNWEVIKTSIPLTREFEKILNHEPIGSGPLNFRRRNLGRYLNKRLSQRAAKRPNPKTLSTEETFQHGFE